MSFSRHPQSRAFSISTETPFSPTTADTPMEDQSQNTAPTPQFTSFTSMSADASMQMDVDMEMDLGSTTSAAPVSQQSTATSKIMSVAAAVTATTTTMISKSAGLKLMAPTTQEQQSQQQSGLLSRRAAKNAAFGAKVREMALPLAPLVQLTSGAVHPSYPHTLLNYWLLTEAELESLAHFYHQRTPSRWSQHYPCPVTWRPDLTLEEKRRKIGKFIGLRGCETPVRVRSEEELREEARRARIAAAEEEAFKRKMHWS